MDEVFSTLSKRRNKIYTFNNQSTSQTSKRLDSVYETNKHVDESGRECVGESALTRQSAESLVS